MKSGRGKDGVVDRQAGGKLVKELCKEKNEHEEKNIYLSYKKFFYDKSTVIQNSKAGIIADNALTEGGINKKGEKSMELVSVGLITGTLLAGAVQCC